MCVCETPLTYTWRQQSNVTATLSCCHLHHLSNADDKPKQLTGNSLTHSLYCHSHQLTNTSTFHFFFFLSHETPLFHLSFTSVLHNVWFGFPHTLSSLCGPSFLYYYYYILVPPYAGLPSLLPSNLSLYLFSSSWCLVSLGVTQRTA